MSDQTQTADTEAKDSTHVMIGAVRFDYVKKITRSVVTIPPIGDKPTLMMRLSGTVNEGVVEAGDERDFTRWTGLITCQGVYRGTPINVISRGIVLPELDELFQEHFAPMKRRSVRGSDGGEYLGLPDFTTLEFCVDVAVVKPAKANRRGYDVALAIKSKPTVVFAGHHIHEDVGEAFFKRVAKPAKD